MNAPRCEVCGEREALYVCSSCGARVCGRCIDFGTWRCVNCLEAEAVPPELRPVGIPSTFFTLLSIGFLFIFLGFALMFVAGLLSGGNVGGGIFVWPIPLVFGFGSGVLVSLALLVLVFLLAVVLISLWLSSAS